MSERIKLVKAGGEFHRIILETPNKEETEYQPTPASLAYDFIEVINIYTLRQQKNPIS